MAIVRKAVLGMMAVRRLTLSPHSGTNSLAEEIKGYKADAEKVRGNSYAPDELLLTLQL